MTNILLTSAGRRSYLVNYFKDALAGNGKVVVANTQGNSPAMLVADKAIVVPPSFDDNYIPTIVNICKKYDIDLICSLHDLDVFVLSNNLEQLRETGAFVVVPSAKWARICLDKFECNNYLKKQGISVPWSDVNLNRALSALKTGELNFPVILKARFGFGSLGLNLCHNIDELKYHFTHVLQVINSQNYNHICDYPGENSVLIQQGLGGKEYCINVVNDLQGQYVSHFASEVHAMRAGETDSVTTTDPNIAGDLPKKLSNLTHHPGIWGVDIMFDELGNWYVVDVNPRFTGDYPFQHICGANIPAAMIAWRTGNKVEPAWFSPESGITGFKDLVPKRIPEKLI